MPADQPRQHHYVPAGYLARFTPEGTQASKLWVTDFDRRKQYPASPTNTGKERDYNRVERTDGGDEFAVEKALAESVDDRGVKVIADLIASGKVPSGEDFKWLMAFIGTMFVRGPFFRSRINDFNERIMKQMNWYIARDDRMFKQFLEGIPEEKRGDPEKLREFMKSENYTVSLDTTTLVSLMLSSADPVAFLLSKRHWHLLVVGDESAEFITSDQPVSLVAKKRLGPFGPAHGMPETWCLFPLDRRHALLGTFEDEAVVEKCDRGKVGFVNTYTALCAERQAFSASKDFVWLDSNGALSGPDALIGMKRPPSSNEDVAEPGADGETEGRAGE